MCALPASKRVQMVKRHGRQVRCPLAGSGSGLPGWRHSGWHSRGNGGHGGRWRGPLIILRFLRHHGGDLIDLRDRGLGVRRSRPTVIDRRAPATGAVVSMAVPQGEEEVGKVGAGAAEGASEGSAIAARPQRTRVHGFRRGHRPDLDHDLVTVPHIRADLGQEQGLVEAETRRKRSRFGNPDLPQSRPLECPLSPGLLHHNGAPKGAGGLFPAGSRHECRCSGCPGRWHQGLAMPPRPSG